MTSYISLAEAASLLGVTKETLRNWDKSGKLKPVRNPANNYRTYLLHEVQAIKPLSVSQDSLFEQEREEKTKLRRTRRRKILRRVFVGCFPNCIRLCETLMQIAASSSDSTK
ncbi:helix-turn-helix domain-containing protein [Pseudoduganella danionis]|uniref:MerR family transcriptional regulator n=1 Tax=Pseudoduganella danionis TaxID=1890295 RepID=UPI00360BFFC5